MRLTFWPGQSRMPGNPNLVFMAASSGDSRKKDILSQGLAAVRKFKELPMRQGTWAAFKTGDTKLKKNPRNKLESNLQLIKENANHLSIQQSCKNIINKLKQLAKHDDEIRGILVATQREVIFELARKHLEGEALCPPNVLRGEELPTDLDSGVSFSLELHYRNELASHGNFAYWKGKLEGMIDKRLAEKMPERIIEPESKLVAILEEIDPMLERLIGLLEKLK